MERGGTRMMMTLLALVTIAVLGYAAYLGAGFVSRRRQRERFKRVLARVREDLARAHICVAHCDWDSGLNGLSLAASVKAEQAADFRRILTDLWRIFGAEYTPRQLFSRVRPLEPLNDNWAHVHGFDEWAQTAMTGLCLGGCGKCEVEAVYWGKPGDKSPTAAFASKYQQVFTLAPDREIIEKGYVCRKCFGAMIPIDTIGASYVGPNYVSWLEKPIG